MRKPLQHPNILAPAEGEHECEAAGPVPSGAETLAQYLARAGRLPALHALALVAQLLAALEHAHARGRVHGRIDPQHVLVARNGHLRVAGFDGSEAHARKSPRDLTPAEAAYTSPEQALGWPASLRSDLYSAGVVAYELLTGALPFRSGVRRGEEAPLDVAAWRPQLPAGLDAVFRRALEPRPEGRFASAAELGAALGEAIGRPIWSRPAATVPAAGRSEPTRVPVEVPSHALVDFAPGVPDVRSSVIGRRLGLGLAVGLVVWLGSLVGDDPAPSRNAPSSVAELDTVERVSPARVPAPSTGTPLPSTPLAASPMPPAIEAGPAQEPARRSGREEPETATRAQQSTAMGAAPAEPSSPREVARATTPPSRDDEPRTVSRKPTSVETRHVVAGPALACRQEYEMARELCAALKCATAEFRRHPVCVRMHAEARVRHQLTEARVAP